MIEFALGVIVGIMFAFLAVSFGSSNREGIASILKKIEIELPRGKVEFIAPLDEKAEAIAEVIKENEAAGKDTNLEELE